MSGAAIARFNTAARDLLRECLLELRKTDPEGHKAVAEAARAGCAFHCVAAASMQGLQEIEVRLVAPTGETVRLAWAEFDELHP